MFDWLTSFVDQRIADFTNLPWPADSILTFDHTVRALLAIFFVCLICGAMGALVVGNRMAFFSDALAHCAFAGVALGLILGLALGGDVDQRQITLVMVLFGIAVGVLIAYVRETTNLANDTVIGVFYAAAVGLGAVFMRWGAGRQLRNIETFIFGDPNTAQTWEILLLAALAVGTIVFLVRFYNPVVMASANTSPAPSRPPPPRPPH